MLYSDYRDKVKRSHQSSARFTLPKAGDGFDHFLSRRNGQKYFYHFLGERVKGFYDIDISIGRDVTFQVNFSLLKDCKIPISKEVTTKVDVKLAGGNQQCQLPLHITLVAPDDLHTLEIDEDFQVNHNQILAA